MVAGGQQPFWRDPQALESIAHVGRPAAVVPDAQGGPTLEGKGQHPPQARQQLQLPVKKHLAGELSHGEHGAVDVQRSGQLLACGSSCAALVCRNTSALGQWGQGQG